MMGERKAPRPEPLEPTNAVGRRETPTHPTTPTTPTTSPTTWRPPVALSGPQHLVRLPVGRCVAACCKRCKLQLTVASSDSSRWRLGTDGLGEAACIAIAGTQARWQTASVHSRWGPDRMGLGHQGRWCRAKRVGSESGLHGLFRHRCICLKYSVSVLPLDIGNNCAMSSNGLFRLKFSEW